MVDEEGHFVAVDICTLIVRISSAIKKVSVCAVVTRHHDNGVVRHVTRFEFLHETAELYIEIIHFVQRRVLAVSVFLIR